MKRMMYPVWLTAEKNVANVVRTKVVSKKGVSYLGVSPENKTLFKTIFNGITKGQEIKFSLLKNFTVDRHDK